MGRSFKYAILQASPDPRRGERVNIGVIVFLPDRIDVRFAELRKLQALTGQKWDKYASEYKRKITSVFVEGIADAMLLKRVAGLENVILPSEFGWFNASDADEYERRIFEILATFIKKPQQHRTHREQRLNTEIARDFRRVEILSDDAADLSHHKVVRDFYVEESLRADFVVKNGVYHVTATLDLRKAEVNVAEAALKAVVLDRARKTLSPDARRFGVYAATDDAAFHSHIHVLQSYADETFNWLDRDEREAYRRRMFDAVGFTIPIARYDYPHN